MKLFSILNFFQSSFNVLKEVTRSESFWPHVSERSGLRARARGHVDGGRDWSHFSSGSQSPRAATPQRHWGCVRLPERAPNSHNPDLERRPPSSRATPSTSDDCPGQDTHWAGSRSPKPSHISMLGNRVSPRRGPGLITRHPFTKAQTSQCQNSQLSTKLPRRTTADGENQGRKRQL